MLGKFDEAIAEESKARMLSGEKPPSVLDKMDLLRRASGARGAQGYWEAELQLSQREQSPPEAYISPSGLAIIYSHLGDKEKALALRLPIASAMSGWRTWQSILNSTPCDRTLASQIWKNEWECQAAKRPLKRATGGATQLRGRCGFASGYNWCEAFSVLQVPAVGDTSAVLGREGGSLSCSNLLFLAGCDSLKATVATGVLLFEIAGQRWGT